MIQDPLACFHPLFHPQAVAVVGASSSGAGTANNFLRNLRPGGFQGRIYVVHPRGAMVEGFASVPSLRDLPEPVDYAYVAVAAAQTPDLFKGAREKVRFVQVISGGFAEGGERGLQDRLVDAVHRAGARLIGPNCLGVHAPHACLSFVDRIAFGPGEVGIVSQSGGLGVDILRRGQMRGLKFSGLVTVGNCADLTATDLARYYLADTGTRVIGLYLEDARDGRALFEALRAARGRKPVVILKGGRTSEGQRASASHTAALAQDYRLWQALARQTGAVLVETLDEFIDALLIFQAASPRPAFPTRRVALFGNGGGTSVLATDAFSQAGFSVPELAKEALDHLRALALPPGASLANPVDIPAGTLRRDEGAIAGQIFAAFARDPSIGAVVVHLNMTVILGYADPRIVPNLFNSVLAARAGAAGRSHFILVLRSDGQLDIEQQKQLYAEQATSQRIPVFNELAGAARALRALADFENFLHGHGRVAKDRATRS